MPRYRDALPQTADRPFLTEGGLETTLIFHEGLDLPCFAAFPLVLTEEGRAILARYFRPYLDLAAAHGTGLILDAPTWRANTDWGARLGFDADALAHVNRTAIDLLAGLRDGVGEPPGPLVLNGVVGPRGDGYRVDAEMSPVEAATYHGPQIEAFRGSEADMVSAVTLTYAAEAVGIARAAQAAAMPLVLSFTVETDGRLPSGQSLKAAIEETDAATGGYPAYYMINCAHPLHFEGALPAGAPWLDRLGGLRANASTKSHAELDAATELDTGDPSDLGRRYAALRGRLRQLRVLGGCCGADHRHVGAICEACL